MLDHVMDADSAVELLTAFGVGGVDARLAGQWTHCSARKPESIRIWISGWRRPSSSR
jgi:hypothetical protein